MRATPVRKTAFALTALMVCACVSSCADSGPNFGLSTWVDQVEMQANRQAQATSTHKREKRAETKAERQAPDTDDRKSRGQKQEPTRDDKHGRSTPSERTEKEKKSRTKSSPKKPSSPPPSSSSDTSSLYSYDETPRHDATRTRSNSSSSPYTSGDMCQGSQLELSVNYSSSPGDATEYAIVFKNTSSTTCTLAGFPGVSFLTSDGRQIGPPSDRTAHSYDKVTLNPNSSGRAMLTIGSTDQISGCSSRHASKIKVIPPDRTDEFIENLGVDVCSGNTYAAIVGPFTG